MGKNIKLQLTSAEHGFDNFNVIDHPEIYRVAVGHGIKRGDIFNVYGPESTKRGATWRGSVEASLASFWRVSADTIEVSREMVQTNEKGVSPMSSQNIDGLEEKYIEAAQELQSKQRDLLNYAPELQSFIEIRDAIKVHADFSGYLPETYFSGGDLDPIGTAPKAKPTRMRP